jgi:transposase
MLSVPEDLPAYLAIKPIDMRKSFDGMTVYIQSCLKMNPLKDGVFVFRNKAGDKVKLIFWNHTGLVIVYKRLEQGRFKWPRPDESVMALSRQDLELLLDGIDIGKLKRLPSLHFEVA